METTILMLCLKVFFARIIDVSLGTTRVMLISKGRRFSAASIAFIEMLIWFFVAKDALNNATNIWVAIAYAGGFAVGTFVGVSISNRFIKGNLGVQVITSRTNDELVNQLRNEGYAVSVTEAKGKDSEKYVLFIEINKANLDHLRDVVKDLDPSAFMVANETKFIQNGFIK